MRIVSKSEYDNFDVKYAQAGQKLKKIDSVSFLLTAGIMGYLIYTIFSRSGVSDDTSQLIWATTIIGVTTLLVIWKDRKNITGFTYKSRMVLFAGLLAVVLFSLTVQDYLSLGWLLILLPLTVLTRTLTIDRQPKSLS